MTDEVTLYQATWNYQFKTLKHFVFGEPVFIRPAELGGIQQVSFINRLLDRLISLSSRDGRSSARMEIDEFDAEKELPEIKRGTAISNPVERRWRTSLLGCKDLLVGY